MIFRSVVSTDFRRRSIIVISGRWKVNTAYSGSVLLPKTSYPPWIGDRTKRRDLDDRLRKLCAGDEFYDRQLNSDRSKPLFVVHDGPPYANGDVHIGHAINKLLKDFVVRYKILDGHRVHFRPGWDCHGLPIEIRVLKESGVDFRANSRLPSVEIRKLCLQSALQTVETQSKAFQTWSCLGDWQQPYRTCDNEYVAKQIRAFYQLFKDGYVYRAYRPVYWSPSSGSALADAELKYNPEHESTAVYFRMPLVNIGGHELDSSGSGRMRRWALIWTTTPWTLPANDAILYKANGAYCWIEVGNEIYLVAEAALEKLRKAFNVAEVKILKRIIGSTLENVTYSKPGNGGRLGRFLASDSVEETKGTGLTHAAFAHGHTDFAAGQKHGMEVQCGVDELGNYDNSFGAELSGKNVLNSDTTLTVLQLFRENVVNVTRLKHSYPYDWRTDQPVIVRSCKQWFIDAESLRDEANRKLLESTRFLPESRREGMLSALKDRPAGWCISRQRSWGVPIPVFYFSEENSDRFLLDETSIAHLSDLFRQQGADCWWTDETDRLLPNDRRDLADRVRPGRDIFDVWFDSGLSWSASGLPIDDDGRSIADAIVEGTDQFRGWFQSQLLLSVALQRSAPYRDVFVHGFVVDEDGKKMSKSIGNVIDPTAIIDGDSRRKFPVLGIDGLRFLAAINCDQSTIKIGPTILSRAENTIREFRKVARFCLGVLGDFRDSDRVTDEQLLDIDRYLLHCCSQYLEDAKLAYDNYNFSKVLVSAQHFMDDVVANLYITVAKHRLYCAASDQTSRRAAQTTLESVIKATAISLWPIMPHLSSECLQFLKADLNAINWPEELAMRYKNEDLAGRFHQAILPARAAFLAEVAGKADPQQFRLIIESPSPIFAVLRNYDYKQEESELRDLMLAASVEVVENNNLETVRISVKKDDRLERCPRCRRYSQRWMTEDHLCAFCHSILSRQRVEARN